jgi:hypothetical protein
MQSGGTNRQRIYDKYFIDTTIKSKKRKTGMLIDVAVPAERNITQQGAEKKLKCENLRYNEREN